MIKRKSIGIINTFLALMIVALLCVPSALVYAYTTTGIKLNTDYTLTFVPYSGFEATSISHFNEALYQWNSAAGITLMSREPTLRHSSTTFPEDDNKTRIYKAYADPSAPGWTRVYTSTLTPNIAKSVDIDINTAFTWANSATPGAYDVWTVFIHEAGHAAGLGHTTSNGAVMNVYPAGNTYRYLNSDDINGITSLY